MSSHHFVTESQSSALVMAGADIDDDALFQLLEWNPLVISRGSELARMIAMDIRIDIIVVSGNEHIPKFPYSVQIWEMSGLTDRLAQAAVSRKVAGVTIVGPGEDEMTRLLALFSGFELPVVCHTTGKKHILLRKGSAHRKWMPLGSIFQLRHEQADISGDIEQNGHSFKVRSNGWIEISPGQDLVLTEFV